MTHTWAPVSSLDSTGVMKTTFITVSNRNGTEGDKHFIEVWMEVHNEVKTAACNQSGCKMCKPKFHKGEEVIER